MIVAITHCCTTWLRVDTSGTTGGEDGKIIFEFGNAGGTSELGDEAGGAGGRTGEAGGITGGVGEAGGRTGEINGTTTEESGKLVTVLESSMAELAMTATTSDWPVNGVMQLGQKKWTPNLEFTNFLFSAKF
jgi:hypothetical protein